MLDLVTRKLAERDRLRALPERQPPELGEMLAAFHDGREMVARQRSGLRTECAMAVREEKLGLGDAAGEEEELAGRGVAGGVLGADPELAVAPRDPVRLAAPAAVDHAVLERQDPAEGGDGRRRVLLEEARPEGQPGGDDLQQHAGNLPMREPAGEQVAL